jgi:hypothetical protein
LGATGNTTEWYGDTTLLVNGNAVAKQNLTSDPNQTHINYVENNYNYCGAPLPLIYLARAKFKYLSWEPIQTFTRPGQIHARNIITLLIYQLVNMRYD